MRICFAILALMARGCEDPAPVERPAPVMDAGPTAFLKLRCALRERHDVEARRTAAGALGAMGGQAAADLVEALGDPDSVVRSSSLCSLVRIGAAAVPALLEAFAERDPDAVPGIVQALGCIVPEGTDALQSIGDGLIEDALAGAP